MGENESSMIPADDVDDFKAADAGSYHAHIAAFERFTSLLTTPLAKRMVAMAQITPGQRVLDIETGLVLSLWKRLTQLEVRGKF